MFLLDPEEARHLGTERLARARRAIAPHAISAIRLRGGEAQFPMPAPQGVLANIDVLHQSARYAGHINVTPDPDGTLRRSSLIVRDGGAYFPSGDLQAARAWLGGDDLLLTLDPLGIGGLSLGGRFVPTDEYGRLLVRYRGPEQTFKTVSVADILAGRVDATLLRGRVVLIGPTAKGIGDIRVTPYGTAYPGVEVRASVIESLLTGSFLQRPEWTTLFDGAVILVIGLALAWWLPRLSVRAGAALALGVLAAYLLAANTVFQTQGLWINVVYPATLIALLFVSTTLVQYFSTESEKRQLKSAFQHYVPAKVVDEIVADVDKLRLGGEKRELTVLFSDIRGFTSLSESLAPEDLVKLLNVYLTEMTRKVFQHDGLLDKYIGDAIMAVYGAPIPRADHALAACRTALDMMEALGTLQAQWRASRQPVLEIGIGINTGPMIVGNMGSEDRFNYTVIGDAVNLGSRIESLNKVYGTRILLSDFAYRQVAGQLPGLREIDVTQVRGRHEPVRIHELIPPQRFPHLEWLPEFERAYRMHHEGALAEARAIFERLANSVGDPVSRYYLALGERPLRRAEDHR